MKDLSDAPPGPVAAPSPLQTQVRHLGSITMPSHSVTVQVSVTYVQLLKYKTIPLI